MIPLFSLCLDQNEAGQHSRDEWYSQINKNALGDLTDADIHGYAVQPEHRGQHRNKDPGVQTVEQHLKYTVKCDKSGRVFAIAAGEFVPDDDHRDAPGQTDHDQPDHIIGLAAQKDDRKAKHQDRADDPILYQREPEYPRIFENLAEILISYLGKRRIHHQDQPGRDRDICGADVKAVEDRFDRRIQKPDRDAYSHRQKDPKGQKAIQKRKPTGRVAFGDGHIFGALLSRANFV